MKVRLLASLVSLVSLHGFAGVTCKEAKEVSHKEEDRLHTFSYRMECVDNTPSLPLVAEKAVKYLNANGSVSNVKPASSNGMSGQTFSWAEKEYDTGSGDIQKTFQITALSNDSQYELSATTTDIDADGYADATKMVRLKVTYEKSGKISVTETTKLEKPWIAPTGIFVSRVREGLKAHLAEFGKQVSEAID